MNADEFSRFIDDALTAHGTLVVDRERFEAFVRGKLAASPGATLHGDDLCLAFACADDVPGAIELLSSLHFGDLGSVVRRTIGDAARAADTLQDVRAKLFTRDGDRPGKIADYGGRGSLRAWLRTVAARAALNDVTRGPRETPSSDELLGALPSPDDDAEMAYAKRLYGAAYREAFADAAAALAPEDRNLLRFAYLDHLGIDEIAALLHIHRATAARRVTKARETLADAVRATLGARLKASETELRSIERLVASQLSLSIERHLRKP